MKFFGGIVQGPGTNLLDFGTDLDPDPDPGTLDPHQDLYPEIFNVVAYLMILKKLIFLLVLDDRINICVVIL